MLKIRQTCKKPTLAKPLRTNSPAHENLRPLCFNKKGSFSSEIPYNEDYLRAKETVFKKYRSKDQELVFIEPEQTKIAAFIQKGVTLPLTHPATDPKNPEKIVQNMLRTYIHRKERKEQIENIKYCPSATRCESFQDARSARTLTKSLFSRVSTSRSALSNKEN